MWTRTGDALAVEGAFVIPTDGLSLRADDADTPYPNDRIHFGTQGQLDLGRRMADEIHEHLFLPRAALATRAPALRTA